MTTRLLILHSDRALRCPISEGEQMFTALKLLGREVRMVRFEGQSHDLSRSGHPRSRVIRLRHIVSWFISHIRTEVVPTKHDSPQRGAPPPPPPPPPPARGGRGAGATRRHKVTRERAPLSGRSRRLRVRLTD